MGIGKLPSKPQTSARDVSNEPTKPATNTSGAATTKPKAAQDILEKSGQGAVPESTGNPQLENPKKTGALEPDHVSLAPELNKSIKLDIDALTASAPKPLEHRWDLAKPTESVELLSRFAHNRKDKIEREQGSLPALEFWEGLADRTFSRAHTTLTAMEAAADTPDAMSLEKACQNLFIYNHDSLELDGLTITDPGILQALRMIRVARNPLTPREAIVADHAFRNHQPGLNKSDIETILKCDNDYAHERIDDTLQYFDMVSRNLPGFEAGIDEATRLRETPNNIRVQGDDGRSWEIMNEPLEHALTMLAAKDDPYSLESIDDTMALENFIERRGGPENVHLDRETIAALVQDLHTQQTQEYEQASQMLEQMEDDPNSIALMARSILLSDENRGQLGRTTSITDLRFVMNDNMRSAMRIIAHETDKPSIEIPGTGLNVANWHFKRDGNEPEYTLECVRGIIGAMKEFDTDQSQNKVARLADAYDFKVDRKQKLKKNIDQIDQQFGDRIKQYAGIETALTELTEALADPIEGETETATLKRIRWTVDNEISPAVQDADGKQFLEFFSTSLDAAIYRNMQDSLTQEITEQLAYLEKGGASESASFKVGAGWGIGPVANMNAGIDVKLAITGNDDRRVREGKSITVSVGAKAKTGIASLLGKLGIGGKKGKTFKSVEDFVKYHRDDVLMMVLQNSESGQRYGKRNIFKRANKLNELTKQQMDRFDRSAQYLGVIGPNEGIVVDPNKKPVPTETTTVSASQSIAAKFGEGVGELSAQLSANQGVTVFHKRVDLLDFLKDNLDSVDSVSNLTPKQTSIPAYPGYETMEAFEKRLEAIDDPQAKAQAIIDAMETVHAEVTRYNQLLRQYDSLKGPFSWLRKGPMERQLHDIKHSFQESRGVHDRGTFLKATITSHARLLSTLHKHCDARQIEEFDFKTMEDSYRYPRVVLKEKHVKKLHQQVTKTGKALEVAFDVSVAGPIGTSVTAGAKLQKIINNSNPDNDGTYLNLKLEGSIDYSKVLPAIIDEIGALPALNPDNPTKAFECVSEAIGKAVKTVEPVASKALDITLDSKIPNGATVELNFIKSFDMSLQYARVTVSGGPSLDIEDIAVGGGVNVSVGGAKTWSRQLTERLGSNTFSYALTQFNGFKLAGGDWETKWNAWAESNQNQMWALAQNIGTVDTNANKEIRIMANLDDGEMASYTKLKETTKAIAAKDGFDAKLYQQFMADLQAFVLATQPKGSLSVSNLQEKGWKPRAD